MFGTASWSRMNSASMPPTTKKTSAGQHVENADALVIDGREPRQLAVRALLGVEQPARATDVGVVRSLQCLEVSDELR